MSLRILAPAYLALCLVAGGSAQGIWSNALLQLSGLGILLTYAWVGPVAPWSHRSRMLAVLTAAFFMVAFLQLLPVPSWIWTNFAGGEFLVSGNRILGAPLDARPISMSPWDGWVSLVSTIPALAMVAAIGLSGRQSGRDMAIAVLIVAMVGMTLGAAQIASADPLNSPLYPYANSNFGSATGFFANSNHMASLLVAAILCSGALARHALDAPGGQEKRVAVWALLAATNLLLLIGLAMNGSLAGYLFIIPALAISVALFAGIAKGSAGRKIILGLCGLFLVSILAIRVVGIGALDGAGASLSVQSRAEVGSTSLSAARDFLPFGSGLGSYAKVYRLYENPQAVGATYVNHAHNDYLELLVEGGIPFALLTIAFLLWWTTSARSIWRSTKSDLFARMATGISAILLVHSLVDFPMRTAALSALFAAAIGLMLLERRTLEKEVRVDRRATRHIIIG